MNETLRAGTAPSAGAWPKATKKVGAYAPAEVVERAAGFVQQNLGLAGYGVVLDSIVGMVAGGVVGKDVGSDLAEAAVAMWPHDARTVGKNAESLGPMMTPKAMCAMLIGMQPSDLEADDLQVMATAARGAPDHDEVETARLILDTKPVELLERPDGALAAWLDAIGERAGQVLTTLLQDYMLNDAQCERLYRSALGRVESLGFEFLCQNMPLAIESGKKPRLRAAAIEGAEEVEGLAVTADEKSVMVNGMIPLAAASGKSGRGKTRPTDPIARRQGGAGEGLGNDRGTRR